MLRMELKHLKAMALALLLLALYGCGTANTVQLSAKPFNISGAHSAGEFSIQRLQLSFSGLSSKTIAPNERLNPSAVIKYQGSGVFIAQWLLNGQIIEHVNMVLNRGSLLTLSPKFAKSVSAQPFGRHELQLKVIQPAPNFKSPKITFFVTR